jgi:hypothetical protein
MAASRAGKAENRPTKKLAGQRRRWLNPAAIMAQFLTATDSVAAIDPSPQPWADEKLVLQQ